MSVSAKPKLSMTGAVITLAFAVVLAIAAPMRAAAQAEVVLTVEQASGGEGRGYTLADLAALPRQVIRTSTPWTEGVQEFAGVPLAALVAEADARDQLLMTAVNEYSVTVPVAELSADAPIVAYERNGAPMSLREKGPLWVVYPYDAGGDFQTETIYSRSIWQLVHIRVESGSR